MASIKQGPLQVLMPDDLRKGRFAIGSKLRIARGLCTLRLEHAEMPGTCWAARGLWTATSSNRCARFSRAGTGESSAQLPIWEAMKED